MGRMKDYVMWLEEKGYVEWDELHGGYTDNKNPDKSWAEYTKEMTKHDEQRNQTSVRED